MFLIFPLYHIGGICACLLPALYTGTTVVTYQKFDFEQFLSAVPKYKVSHMENLSLFCQIFIKHTSQPVQKKN